MSLTLPKVRIGKNSRKRNVFDKSHDVNTTSGFGYCQCIGCQPMVPGSKAIIGTKHFVRMQAMPKPTRGSLSLHTYHRFVPIEDLFEPFQNMMTGTAYNSSILSYIPQEVPNIYQKDLMLLFLNMSDRVSFYESSNGGQSYNLVTEFAKISYCVSRYNQAFNFSFADPQHNPYWLVDPRMTNIDSHVKMQEADFILRCDTAGEPIRQACFKFGFRAKNVRKTLLGCGYQINLKVNRKVSLLPLFAYYKAYFDQFAPVRVKTWTDTAMFAYLNDLMQNGVPQRFNDGGANLIRMKEILNDISEAFYTINPDYYTAHIANPSNSVTIDHPNFLQPTNNQSDYIDRDAPTSLPYLRPDSLISRVSLQMLNRFTKYINKDSVIGKKVDDLLFKYGAKPVHNLDSNYIGSTITPCQIGDNLSTAETNDGHLGEWSGVGVGQDTDLKKFDFTSTTFGYWITMIAIVPQAGYCQTMNSNGAIYHLDRWQFFNEEFDAIGYQATSNEEFIGQSDYAKPGRIFQPPVFFGRIPRYSEYKVKSNLISGDLSLRSTRDGYLGYTLDRYYAPDDFTVTTVNPDTGVTTGYESLRPDVTVNESMRYIGMNENAGNFNRIFYNSHDLFDDSFSPQDNFIVHTYVDFKFIAPMLSLGDSFDTDAESDVTTNVEHQ